MNNACDNWSGGANKILKSRVRKVYTIATHLILEKCLRHGLQFGQWAVAFTYISQTVMGRHVS